MGCTTSIGHGLRVSKGIRNAALLDSFLGGSTPKTARLMIKQHGPELGFTMKDFIKQRVLYGSAVTAITRVTRDRIPQGPVDRHTNVPGEIIQVDLKQVGGVKGSQEMLVLHGVCQVTNYQLAVRMNGDSAKSLLEATKDLVYLFKAHAAASKIEGAGRVRQMWWDGDPKVKNIKDYWIDNNVQISQSSPNHYCPKVEACIRQVDIMVARIREGYPVYCSSWLSREFWIGQTSVHNLIPSGSKELSPFTKYTGKRFDFGHASWSPVGQLVVVRRTDNDLKARAKDKSIDAMIGKPRGKLAILLGINVCNPTCRWVLPITEQMTFRSVNKLQYTADLRCVPMDPSFFPLCFQRKNWNGMGRHISPGYWRIWEHEREMRRSCRCSVGLHSSKPAEQEVGVPQVQEGAIDNGSCMQKVDEEVQHGNSNLRRGRPYTPELIDSNTREVMLAGYTEGRGMAISDNDYGYNHYNKNKEEEKNERSRGMAISDNDYGTNHYNKISIAPSNIMITRFGKDAFLELKDAKYWSGEKEIKESELEAKQIVEEIKADLSRFSGVSDEMGACGGSLGDDVGAASTALSCLYTSPSMNPKEAAMQKDKRLVKAAVEAIKDEKESLIRNGVIEAIRWNEIPAKSRDKILRAFIFVVNKYDPEGNFLKAKARYVVNGKTQPDSTYGWTASPVVARPLVYLLITWSLIWGNLKDMDVPKAFQIPEQEEELYIRMESGELYKLLRALYGCKHSAWKFYILLRKVLIDAGWQPTQYDGGTLTYVQDDELIGVMALHVDDILVTYKYDFVYEKLIKTMEERFGQITVGNGENFLGMRIERYDDHVYVSQPAYLEQLGEEIQIEKEFEKYHGEVEKWKKDILPWNTTVKKEFAVEKSDDLGEKVVNQKKFMKLIGELQYAAQLRCEVSPVLGMLASQQNCPVESDWIQALRLAWYLRNTSKVGLRLTRPDIVNGKLVIAGSADASFKNGTGKSRIGITVSLGMNCAPILVISKKQPTCSGSSTESEMKGYNYGGCVIEWIRNVMMFVYRQELDSSIVEVDNKPSTLAIKSACITTNLKHMHPGDWYCRLLYQERKVIFAWVSTKELLADALTKPVGPKDFRRYRSRLLGDENMPDTKRKLILPNGKEIWTIAN